MEKNVAGKWVVFAYGLPDHASPGVPLTGDAANITANIRIDGGAANAVDDVNPTELEDGYYIFDITAAESNGENLLLTPQSSTANVQVIAVPGAVWTRPANFSEMGIETDGDLTQVNNSVTNGDMVAEAPAASVNATAVWEELTATARTAGTYGQLHKDNVDGTISSRMAETSINTTAGAVDTVTANTDMRGTNGANTTVPDAAGVAPTAVEIRQEMDTNSVDLNSILTNIAALKDISIADVNAQMLDVLQTDTFAELAAIPAATSSLKDKITFMFMLARNQVEQTATTQTLRRDDTTTAVGTATVSDDTVTFTRGEMT